MTTPRPPFSSYTSNYPPPPPSSHPSPYPMTSFPPPPPPPPPQTTTWSSTTKPHPPEAPSTCGSYSNTAWTNSTSSTTGSASGSWTESWATSQGSWDYYYRHMQGGAWERPPPPPPPPSQPPAASSEDGGPPPAKMTALAPPGEEEAAIKVAPEWQAAKKGAVIYTTPRPPTPEAPKVSVEAMAPHGPVVVPLPPPITYPPETPSSYPPPEAAHNPVTYMDVLTTMNTASSYPPGSSPQQAQGPKKKQFFYDGESWVYAYEQPPMKAKQEVEDPVTKAVLANMRGKFNFQGSKRHPDKPKAVPVKCEVCGLTVSCMKTYESHIAGKPHKKKVAQKERAKALEEKVKEDTERAKNSLPGGQVLDNPLESLETGDIRCKVCEVTMNSGAQAQSHLNGVKHRHKMDKHMRGTRGRGRGRGEAFVGLRGGFNQGPYIGPGWGAGYVEPGYNNPPEEEKSKKQENTVTTEEAEEEYKRVFNEYLENNFDLALATKAAKAAMRAALGIVDSEDEEEGEDGDGEDDEEETFPPPGITIVTPPSSDGQPGSYQCEVCSIELDSDMDLSSHLSSEQHTQAVAAAFGPPSILGKRSWGGGGRGEVVEPGRGRVYRGRPNAMSADTMKAQRGRRGLISYGEVMPSKLTKSQKKLAKKQSDISSLLAAHKVDAALAQPHQEKPKIPLLQAFVKGDVEKLESTADIKYQCNQ